MRKLLVVVLFLGFILKVESQNLTVEGTAPDLYLTHTVAPKENFYSIARLYNQPPKSIASYNNLVMEKGLTIGQKVKIPLNDQNFDVTGNTSSGETLIPITHIVEKSETLFKIAGNNNAVAESIRKWNNLSSDNIAPGTSLVIGHLKVNNSQSSGSLQKSPEATVNNNVSAPSVQEDTTEAKSPATEAPEHPPISADQKHEDLPESERGGNSNNATGQLAKDTALAVVSEEPKTTANISARPASENVAKQQDPSVNSESKQSENITNVALTSSEGAFANLFNKRASIKSLNTKIGEAATFKSTSGWQDKKYYALISNVPPGTIVKISSGNNKVVYAKVLGSMPEMKENEGLLVRMSNAAASSLGVIDPKFSVEITYYQ